jgi:hypothetical protein
MEPERVPAVKDDPEGARSTGDPGETRPKELPRTESDIMSLPGMVAAPARPRLGVLYIRVRWRLEYYSDQWGICCSVWLGQSQKP